MGVQDIVTALDAVINSSVIDSASYERDSITSLTKIVAARAKLIRLISVTNRTSEVNTALIEAQAQLQAFNVWVTTQVESWRIKTSADVPGRHRVVDALSVPLNYVSSVNALERLLARIVRAQQLVTDELATPAMVAVNTMANSIDLIIEQLAKIAKAACLLPDEIVNINKWIGELRSIGTAANPIQVLSNVNNAIQFIANSLTLYVEKKPSPYKKSVIKDINAAVGLITTLIDEKVIESAKKAVVVPVTAAQKSAEQAIETLRLKLKQASSAPATRTATDILPIKIIKINAKIDVALMLNSGHLLPYEITALETLKDFLRNLPYYRPIENQRESLISDAEALLQQICQRLNPLGEHEKLLSAQLIEARTLIGALSTPPSILEARTANEMTRRESRITPQDARAERAKKAEQAKRVARIKRAENCYQDYLIRQALAQANAADAQTLRFDPQGSLLTSVTLNDKDYEAVLIAILVALGTVPAGTAALTATDKAELEALAEVHYAEGTGASRDTGTMAGAPFSAKELLQSQLGSTHSLTATTIANIDVSLDARLTEKYRTWLTVPPLLNQPHATNYRESTLTVAAIKADPLEHLVAATDVLLDQTNRLEAGSINAIGEEIEMHLSLALHVLEKAFKDAQLENPVSEEIWAAIRNSVFREINRQVKDIFQRALVASFDSEHQTIDYVHLNAILDTARKSLSKPENGYRLLAKQARAHIVNFDAIVKDKTIQQAISKHRFSATTASSNDYLTASHLGLNARIEGTNNTAHHKERGLGHQAARIIRYSDGSMMMRLPSIPEVDIKYRKRLKTWVQETQVSFYNMALSVPNGVIRVWNVCFGPGTQEYMRKIGPWQAKINDTALKIAEAEQALRSALGDYRGPIILNRETSIPHWLLDKHMPGANKQAERIEIEIKAIHQVNATRTNGPFVFIQGIAVNQHSQNLGYSTLLSPKSAIIQETTLMADMAMLANLQHQVTTGVLIDPNGVIRKAYTDVMALYQKFLQDNAGNPNAMFSASHQFSAVKAVLTNAKEAFKEIEQPNSTHVKTMANQALLKIFAHDLHYEQENGMFVQGLATFAQDGTIAGCKSANERFSAVEGLAVLMRLIALPTSPLATAKREMSRELQTFITAPSVANFDSAQHTMNVNFNKHTLHTRHNDAMSGLDQGAAAKLKVLLERKLANYKANLNTNRAISAVVDRLKTSETSDMQAHKGDHAGDFLRELTTKDNSRMFEDGSKFPALLIFLKAELQRIQKKTVVNDKRIVPLTDLIHEIEDSYSTIKGAELFARMEAIFEVGTRSRLNYGEFLETQQAPEFDNVSLTDSDSGSESDHEGVELRNTLHERPSIMSREEAEALLRPLGVSITEGEGSVASERSLFERSRNVAYSLMPSAVTAIVVTALSIVAKAVG